MTAAGVGALYIHVPFCERKCEYCDFVSIAGVGGQQEYVAALTSELVALGRVLEGNRLDTIFCGGGTPGLLDLGLMAGIMETVRGSFDIASDAEVTLEVNPSSCAPERADAWLAAGFNRVSVGVQGTHGDILGFLGRVHDGPRALGALREVREAGFTNVSADLIYAVPGLDDARWHETLGCLVAAAPDHLSCYELTVEDGTPLHRSVRAGRVAVVDAETALRQHAAAVDLLGSRGYAQYEVSNFAQPGRECRHNLVYWRNRAYAAAGVGAHGHLPASLAPEFGLEPPVDAESFRYQHGRSIPRYREARTAAALSVQDVEWIDGAMRREEEVMLGLRLREGIVLDSADALEEAGALAAAGFLRVDGARVTATGRGEEVLNEVAARLALRTT